MRQGRRGAESFVREPGIASRDATRRQVDCRISGPSPPSSIQARSRRADLPARLPGGARAQRGHQRIGDFGYVARGGSGRRSGSAGVHAAVRESGDSRGGAPPERVPLRLSVRGNKFGTRRHWPHLPPALCRKRPLGMPIVPDPSARLAFKTSATDNWPWPVNPCSHQRNFPSSNALR